MHEIFDKPKMFYKLVEKAMPFSRDRGRVFFTMDGKQHKLYMRSRFHSEKVEDKTLSMKDRPPAMMNLYRLQITFVVEDFFRIVGDYRVIDGIGRNIVVNAGEWRLEVLSTYERSTEELEHMLVLLALE